MRVLVTGSSGLVGSAIVDSLVADGHSVTRLVRSRADATRGEVRWDPLSGDLDPSGLDGLDAVVHLAGESIAAGRWTAARKARIRESRVAGTRTLCDALQRLAGPPGVLVSASAVGYYGDRADEVLDEDSAPGTGFLPEVCVAWEQAAVLAAEVGVRVVRLRIGIVLSAHGGALGRMLTPFRLGLGGILGSGRQYMSWIALDDLVRVFRHAIESGELSGAVNAVAPAPVTNREFTRALGRALSRPTWFPAPAPLLRLALGEMAEALLLASTRVVPARLEAGGFRFLHADPEGALRSVLGRT